MDSLSPHRTLVVLDDLGALGFQRAALAQVAALDRSHFKVQIASLERTPRDDLAGACWDAGLPAHRLRHRREARPRAWVRLMGLIRRSKPHIVHTHGTAAGVLGRTVARLARVPKVVSTVNEIEPWLDGPADRLDRLDRGTLSFCDRILAASDTMRAAVTRVSPELEGRMVRVYPGVDLLAPQALAKRRAAARASLGYTKEQFVIGVGAVEPPTDLETLIYAAALAKAQAPGLELLLVGSDRGASHLEALAAGLRLGDRLRSVRDPQELAECLPAMDLFAWPDRREGCAMELMQAMAAAVPVLAARTDSAAELIEDGVSGRLLPTDLPGDWASAIERLATHGDVREAMAHGAHRRARDFSLSRSVEQLQALYEKLESEEEVATAA